MNSSNKPDSVQLLYVSVATFVSLAGLIPYVFILYILWKYRNTTFSNSFYKLALSLGITDIVTLVIQLTYGTMVIIHGGDSSHPPWMILLMGLLNNSAAWSVLIHVAVISVNRLCAVFMLISYNSMFTGGLVVALVCICNAWPIGTSLTICLCGCRYRLPLGIAWRLVCEPTAAGEGVAMFAFIQSTALTVFVTTIYVVIFTKIKWCKNTVIASMETQARRERCLVQQFFLVCCLYIAYVGFFWIISPAASAGYLSEEVGQSILGLVAILNSAMNPYLYMTFGSELKTKVWSVLFGKNSVAPVGIRMWAVPTAARIPPHARESNQNHPETET